MKKNKLVKLNLFDSEQAQMQGESWQIEITAPVGVSITISSEQTSTEKKIVKADEKGIVQAADDVVDGVNIIDENVVPQFDWSFNGLKELVSAKLGGVAAWFQAASGSPDDAVNENGKGFKAWFKSPQNTLFAASILVYLVIRLIGLMDYPIYFTFDEANATTLGVDFLRDGFRNYAGDLFPAFFPNVGGNYNFGTTVYIQLVSLLIFGRSAYVIRATSVLVGLIGAICLSLALRNIFRVRYWWAGILVLSVIPIWFLMSRTEYAVPTFVSFYSAMLYCYWMYRLHNPKYIYPAVIFAGLAFYAYAPGQALIPLTVVALLVLDFPYHLRTRVHALGAALLGFVCAIPYIRFQITHFGNSAETLNRVGSYWTQDLPLTEKLSDFFGRYLFHLSPVYWFTPAYDATPTDSLLYIMKGYGHLGLWLAPILFWGLLLLIRRLRQPEYRTLLVVLLIVPVGAALVTSPSSITRALLMVIPAGLIASIGLDDLLRRVVGWVRLNKLIPASALLFLVLLSVNSYMLWDVLNHGTSWFDNNQEGGVQFGADKVFTALKEDLKYSPNVHAVISPNWAMISDVVARIYMGDYANISFNSVYDYSHKIVPFDDNTIFVVTPEEFDFAKNNPKFSNIKILRTIPYSASKVGFYFIHIEYSAQARAILDAEDAERRKPLTGEVVIDGEKVQVAYTRNDGTLIDSVFDNDPVSLYKSLEINPVEFDLTYPKEHEFHSINIIHGAAPIELTVKFLSEADVEIKSYTTQFTESGDKGATGDTFNFDQVVKASKVHISVKVTSADEKGIVHIWGITFK